MAQLLIDETKCKQDGICAAECPTGIIQLKDGNGFPEVNPDNFQFCLLCGHCVAVCPNGALSHPEIPIDSCPSIRKELKVSHEQAVQFLRSRRSIRVFKDKAVEQEKIQQLINIARYAPTAANAQLLEWNVYTDKETIFRFAELTIDWMRELIKTPGSVFAPYYTPIVKAWDAGYESILRGAPVVLIPSAPRISNNGLVDLSIALSYLELSAPTLSLGATWAGLMQAALLNSEALQKLAGLPKGHSHHYPMMLGYPKFKYHRLIERKAPIVRWK
ncbi:MAG: 4Fe-4S dicluster domain-containing protein [Desulfobacterales bacterium]|nr:4Fe-4S dicluster domain-containing protein [Desulfobacterales bacterium]